MTISYIGIGDGQLAVEVEGDGPLVVCSPAMGDMREAFAPLAAQLVAGGYQVARIDLRGHGDSSAGFDRCGDEATAEDLLRVIDVIGGGPAVLAGASLSAVAAADPDWKNPLTEAKWVAYNFGDAKVTMVAGAGHALMFERPNIVGPVLSEFLDQIRVDGGFEPGIA